MSNKKNEVLSVNNFVSANNFAFDDRPSTRSFMCIRKSSIGPNMEP